MRPVTIRNLSGEPLPLELSEGVTVREAKNTIERVVGVQAWSLGIFDSARECRDREQLQSTQSLTLVIKLESALHDLHLSDEEDPLHRRRSSALLFLYAHVPREDARTMSRIAAAFGRASSWIRPTAVAADAAHYARGDGRAILGAVALLDHQDAAVRAAAVEAISTVCTKGDELALRAVAWRLVSVHSLDRSEVLRALEILAPHGDDLAVRTVLSRINRDEDSKQALLDRLAGRDSRLDCVNAVMALLREHAMTATSPVNGGSDSESVFKLSARVEHWLTYSPNGIRQRAEDRTHGSEPPRPKQRPTHEREVSAFQEHSVQLPRLDALAAKLGKADSRAWRSLHEQAVNFRDEVRHVILDVMQVALDNGPDHAMDLVVVKLEDPASDVRIAALLLVRLLARRGDRSGIDLAVSRLVDERRDVRVAAVQVVVQLAERGDFYAIRPLASSLGDDDAFVRQEVIRAMGELCSKSDRRTISLLLKVLRHPEATPATKASTLEALAASAEPGDHHVQGIIKEFLLHEDTAVTSAAMCLTSQAAQNKGVTQAWEARKRRSKDDSTDRDKALEMYAHGGRLLKAETEQSHESWADLLQSGEVFTTAINKVWSMFSPDDSEKQTEQSAGSRASHAV